jgi:hypothetical protein
MSRLFYLSRKNKSPLLLIVFIISASSSFADTTTLQIGKGVATPQTPREQGNKELLRERSLKNAGINALAIANGTLVSAERLDSQQTNETSTLNNGESNEQIKQDRKSRSSNVSRVSGHARSIRVLEEGFKGDAYYVTAEFEILNEKQAAPNAGFYWQRAGKPKIILSISESINNTEVVAEDSRTLQYLRNDLVKNGIDIDNDANHSAQYHVRVTQIFNHENNPDLGTTTTHCRLAFTIFDEKLNKSVASEQQRNGPVASFNEAQGEKDCTQSIAPTVSETLIRNLVKVIDSRWSNGVEFTLSINKLPGDKVVEASGIVKGIFRLKQGQMTGYDKNVLSMQLVYTGTREELTEALISSFSNDNYSIIPTKINSNSLEFDWLDLKHD